MASKKLRLLKMGLSTLLGYKQQGFFIPYRYAGAVPGPAERTPYSKIESLFKNSEEDFKTLIEAIEPYRDDLKKIGPDNPPEPRWNQSWFPVLDAAIAYTVVRHYKPARIIEVGSGHSTRFLARAVKDAELTTSITAIDPAPRAVIKGLEINFVSSAVERSDPGTFEDLQSGDILFIDSSHILMPGTDVDYLFNRVLPSVPSGVLVHIHDILLPDDYPEDWQWRGYNEQLAVAGFLHGGGYEPLFSSTYVRTRMSDRLSGTIINDIPMVEGARDTSLWLRKI